MNTTESKEKLIADFKVVIADAEELLQATASEAGEKFSATRVKLEKKLTDAKSRLRDAEGMLLDKGKEAAKVADSYVQENPWKSVGVAAGVGVIIGMLIGRR
ncbi:MAG TPA: DUF883 family protein [Burkholderiales bacterium]|nr:DUF883 family protein [Burkholderiales bacterium]